MPNTRSAAKRLRQNEKQRLRNKSRKTELKTLTKQLDRAIHDKDVGGAQTLYQRYTKRLDQAASNNVLHGNTASRRKSVMAKRLHVLTNA
jgi:small subunit ribosomal protein S20